MADLLEQLEEEHREVERMLDELEESEEAEDRRRILGELEPALARHMAVEEQLLYPLLADLDEESAEEAQVEHDGARELLEKAAGMVEVPGFGAMVAALKGAIAHHVEEEEDETFPRLRDELSEDELGRLTEQAGSVQAGKGAAARKGAGQVRGGRGGPSQKDERTRDELYERAKELGIDGRSGMSRDELADAVASAEGSS